MQVMPGNVSRRTITLPELRLAPAARRGKVEANRCGCAVFGQRLGKTIAKLWQGCAKREQPGRQRGSGKVQGIPVDVKAAFQRSEVPTTECQRQGGKDKARALLRAAPGAIS